MEYRTTDYDGVRLSEYNGKYSIEALKASKDGKFYSIWAKYRNGKDSYQEKNWPVKVILGDREKAKTTLLKMIAEIGESDVQENAPF